MTVLFVGANGATGRLLVSLLLNQGHHVKAMLRSPDAVPKALQSHKSLTIIVASVLNLSDGELYQWVYDCEAVLSCLGHNMSLKGIYWAPRRLVTEATHRLTDALIATPSVKPKRYVLMNTAGNRNRDLSEPISLAHRSIISLSRLLLPPHVDNEKAADFLRIEIGQHDQALEWVVVRPDSLIDTEEVTKYELYPSPIRSALFDAGKTSRINVAHFMSQLITDDDLWNEWKGQMPVIYNAECHPYQ